MTHRPPHRLRHRGFSLIEVLVTLVILLLGLLGLVGLQTRAQVGETESYQRTQALILARDMADRIGANRAISQPLASTAYVTTAATPLGTGSTKNCAAPVTTADLDLCQWDATLKGAAESAGGSCDKSTGVNCVGAMIGARGCISDITGGSPTKVYLVEVAWQGLASSAAPPATLACGDNQFGTEAQGLRRVVSTVVRIGNLALP